MNNSEVASSKNEVIERLHRAIQGTILPSPSETLMLFAAAKGEIQRLESKQSSAHETQPAASNERVCRGCEHKIPWDWVFCAWCGEENDRANPTPDETSDALTVPLKVYDALKVDRDDWRQREHALRAALQKIVDEGDYTAPEGMKRIAQDALISAEEPKVTLEPITDCMLCNRPFTEHTRVCPEKASGEQP